MRFTASRTGDYYIQVLSSHGYNIRVDTGYTNIQTGSLTEFLDASYFLVLILPTFIIILMILTVFGYKKKQLLLNKNWPEVDSVSITAFQQNSSENMAVEKPAKPAEVSKKTYSKDVISIKEVEKILTTEELEEIKQTEGEVGVEEQKFMCIVHKGAIEGANLYLCPECHTLYCVRCATVLREKDEKCWSCDSEINI
jgi:hypothetical protein